LKRITQTAFLLLGAVFVFVLPADRAFSQEGEEETYSISLVQTAESDKEIQEVEGRKVLTETYTIKNGDHVWQLLRQRGLLEKHDLPELLAVLKRLNSSYANLDLIYPGDRIVLPLTLSPVKGLAGSASKKPAIPVSLADLKDLKLENYTVQPGDSLIKVVKSRYGLGDEQISPDYLDQLKRLNPEIENLDFVYPDQVVRLPVYTPQMVRAPIKPVTKPKAESKENREELKITSKGSTAMSLKLSEIFSLMGEEWVNTGEHFIPLSSGGQINLKADSFPILNLTNGNRVIVDLHNELPERMARVISSNWENYRVAHLQEKDDLREALNRIFPLCGFHRLYLSGEPFELASDIRLQITSDWIIVPSPAPQGQREQIILINLTDRAGSRIPYELKDFLTAQGVKSIEYPPSSTSEPSSAPRAEVLKPGHDKAQLIETVLTLAGQGFTKNMEMPLQNDGKSGFNLVVKADFFLYIGKKEAIIDYSGIGSEMIPLLKEYNVSVLSVAGEADPEAMVSRILDFIGVKFDSKPHPFASADKNDSTNIKVTIPGIVFRDSRGQNVFASDVALPVEIEGFLSRKGYRVLSLALS
jgi:hypothetical protein